MTDTIRDLLISLSSHMAYMQGQLEARHELDDPEDYYWYRESVLLRQKVTDALADEPAVPQPQPPAEGEVAELMEGLRLISDGMSAIGHDSDSWFVARAAKLLQRQALVPVSVSERPPEDQLCWWFDPDEEDDEAYGSSWTLLRICGGTSSYTHWIPAHALPIPHQQENAND